MIIVIVGKPASGKSTAAEALKEMGFSVASTGSVIRDEVRRRGLEYNKENDAKMGEWFHQDNRESLVIKRLLKKVSGDKIALEGLRDPSQLEELKKNVRDEIVIIAVDADFEERARRLGKRARFTEETEDYLKSREEREFRHGELKFIEKAHYKIDNTDLTIDEFKEEVKKLANKLLERKETDAKI